MGKYVLRSTCPFLVNTYEKTFRLAWFNTQCKPNGSQNRRLAQHVLKTLWFTVVTGRFRSPVGYTSGISGTYSKGLDERSAFGSRDLVDRQACPTGRSHSQYQTVQFLVIRTAPNLQTPGARRFTLIHEKYVGGVSNHGIARTKCASFPCLGRYHGVSRTGCRYTMS